MDPRFKNEYGSSRSLAEFICNYADRYAAALKSVDAGALDRALAAISSAAANGRKILTIGNGGSAAIADHLCCDFTKGTHTNTHPTLAAHSMGANGALYSAIANDFSFAEVFSKQIEFFGCKGDVLVAISSSGNSANIVRGVEAAQKAGMVVIGLSGFSGGKLSKIADISLHIPVNNYGIVEDCHQSLMHIMAQVIALRRDISIQW